MSCKSHGVSQVLVGLDRVGIAGLAEALRKADESGLADREAIVNLVIETLATDNYIPHKSGVDFRTAIWREYLRYKEEDFSDFYSEVDVIVRGTPGEDLDRFVEMVTSVFAHFELKPNIHPEPPGDDGPNPQLAVRNETIVRGNLSRRGFEVAVRKSLSDW